jgi:membrane protease YdiL (CAAX protease family)
MDFDEFMNKWFLVVGFSLILVVFAIVLFPYFKYGGWPDQGKTPEPVWGPYGPYAYCGMVILFIVFLVLGTHWSGTPDVWDIYIRERTHKRRVKMFSKIASSKIVSWSILATMLYMAYYLGRHDAALWRESLFYYGFLPLVIVRAILAIIYRHRHGDKESAERGPGSSLTVMVLVVLLALTATPVLAQGEPTELPPTYNWRLPFAGWVLASGATIGLLCFFVGRWACQKIRGDGN